MRVRRATHDDVPALLEVKATLRVDPSAVGTTAAGGFLLGTDAAGYHHRIHAGNAWVLEEQHQVVGFAILLGDAAFRVNEVWSRKDAVRWSVQPASFEHQRLCYFDQLAVRRLGFRVRRWAAVLALRAVLDVLEHHHHLVTATVSEPILNLAAVPWLQRLGARRVGRLDETYEGLGALVSDIWLLSRQQLVARCHAPRGDAERWVLAEAKRQCPPVWWP